MRSCTFFSHTKSLKSSMNFTLTCTSQFRGTTFAVLSDHMWLVAPVLNSTVLGNQR